MQIINISDLNSFRNVQYSTNVNYYKSFFIRTVPSVPKRNVALVGLDSVPAPQDAEVGMLEQKESPSKEQVGKSFLL